MPDPFRSTYRQLTAEEKARVDLIKLKAAELHELMNLLPGGTPQPPGAREMALARTNLEQSVMWATKAITG